MIDLSDLALIGASVIATPYLFVATFSFLGNRNSQRIDSQETLDIILDEEADKLGIDKSNLVGYFYAKEADNYGIVRTSMASVRGFDLGTNSYVPFSKIDGEGVVEIKLVELKEGFFGTRSSVRHELYHISNHLPRSENNLLERLKWFYQEPAAALYECTGIRTF